MSVTTRTCTVPGLHGCGLDKTLKGHRNTQWAWGKMDGSKEETGIKVGGEGSGSEPVLLGFPGTLGDQQVRNISAMWYLTHGSPLQ